MISKYQLILFLEKLHLFEIAHKIYQKIRAVRINYLGSEVVKTYPDNIVIDPIAACNLACPLCPTGTRIIDRKNKVLDINTFKMILEKLPPIKILGLYNWGEPLLNPNIIKIITAAKEKNIFVHIDSNMSLEKDDLFFKRLVLSGLDRFVISLDGASQESYSEYRRNGNFELVIKNIKTLIKFKKELSYNTPVLIWKFIVNRYTEGEIETAKNMAHEIGIRIQFSSMGISDTLPDLDGCFGTYEEKIAKWMPVKHTEYVIDYVSQNRPYPVYNEPCPWLFSKVVINPDGTVAPCCFVSSEKSDFGDLNKNTFEEIWNNDTYKYSRSLFFKKPYKGPKVYTVCEYCKNFRKEK